MLTQYKNIDSILNATGPVIAERYAPATSALFKQNGYSFNPDISSYPVGSRLELHVYSNDTWLTGKHWVQGQTQLPVYLDQLNQPIYFNSNPVAIDLKSEFNALGIDAGTYRIVVNFFTNIIGSYEQQYLKVDEISPDRTEVRLRLIDNEDADALLQLTDFINTVSTKQTNVTLLDNTNKTYLLNFSRNKTALFVNSVVVGEFLYVKLLDPLPQDIETEFKCWIVQEKKSPFIDRVSVVPVIPQKTYTELAGPNLEAIGDYNLSTETGYKTWTDLLGSSIQTSQQIVDTYFSGSLSGVKLNIDYTDFNNFVFYSSATERVKNFKYKLELLEYYEIQSVIVSQLSGSVATTNAADFQSLRTATISSFDNFEKFLYYESSSVYYSNPYPHEQPNVASVTGSYITPCPKDNSTRPYDITPTTDPIFTSWFETLLWYAEQYDLNNLNSLDKTIPQHIRYNTDNINMITFVNMLGQHYDVLYLYIHNIHRLYKTEENPKLGIPNELLYSVAKQFGWNLVDGKQDKNLWEYLFGVDEAGTPLTGSNSVTGDTTSAQDITYTTWRRIVNNLPGLLKSKGTKRSIQALLSCYGIPQSLITIKEFGGPRINRVPVYEKLNFDYALDLINNTAGTVTVNYTQPINTVELRFRTDDVVANPTLPNTMHLYSVAGNDVTIDFTAGTYGTVSINGTASAAIEMFDGGWLNTMLRTQGTQLELVVKRAKYGKIVAEASASATASFGSLGTFEIGGTSSGAVRLQGQLQELRLWTGSLDTEPFENHTKAPAAYDGNLDAYDELVFRTPLSQRIDHSATSSLNGVEPNSSGITADFASWSNNIPYDSVEETYYYDGISLAAGTFDDNKVRLESNELIGQLDVVTRAERSQYDKAPVDSKKLGVYFSPQTMINEDIIAQLGATYLDDYIGDPRQTERRSYPDLIQFAENYWKKYETNNDMNAYIKIFTLFDMSFFQQLLQLLPARTQKITGLLIQPNILERSKDTALPVVVPESFTYDAVLDVSADNSVITSEFSEYEATIDMQTLSADSSVIQQYTAELSANTELAYEGTTYCYDYVYFSGSSFVTASSPYWFCDAIQPVFINSVVSEIYSNIVLISNTYGGSVYGVATYGGAIETLTPAQIQDYMPQGIANAYFDGCSMTSENFNVNSIDTIDGGPVVEFTIVNPNQIVFQSANNTNGNFSVG